MTMLLYLARHGDAKSEDEDPKRPLSDKGVEEVKRVAAFLEPLGLGLGALWHSGKARAEQTAEILASALSVKDGIMKQRGLSPMDPVGPILKELVRRDQDLMIVGHLPFLGNLASALLGGTDKPVLVSFEQSAVLCLERIDEENWTVKWKIAPWML